MSELLGCIIWLVDHFYFIFPHLADELSILPGIFGLQLGDGIRQLQSIERSTVPIRLIRHRITLQLIIVLRPQLILHFLRYIHLVRIFSYNRILKLALAEDLLPPHILIIRQVLATQPPDHFLLVEARGIPAELVLPMQQLGISVIVVALVPI